MGKEKIAISLSKNILDQIDAKIDDISIRSRSQSIEVLIKKGLDTLSVNTAVIMLSKSHQKIALSKFKNSTLIETQINFFRNHGINKIFILTQKTEKNPLKKIAENEIEIIENNKKNNGEALKVLKDKINEDFVVMSGDTYNNFNLEKMLQKHKEKNVIGTMGLMSHDKPGKYGSVVLEGDMITNFQEKSKLSNIINAGVYVFKPNIFDILSDCKSLEFDLFPKLASMNQLAGHFTMGEYEHVSESLQKH